MLTYPQQNFLYNHHTQYFEEPKESQSSTLETLLDDMTATLNRSILESMMMERFMETQNATLTHFEEPQESHNLNLEISMEDFNVMLTHSRL